MSRGIWSVAIAPFAHLDELILANAVIDLNVVRSLLGDRGLPSIFAAAGRQVIVAHAKGAFAGEA